MTRATMTAASLFAVVLALPAFADTTINVTLRDTGGTVDVSQDLGFAPGGHADMAAAPMSIEVDKTEVPAGKVTFAVTNASSATIHEMLVVPQPAGGAALPFTAETNRVDEEAAGDLGEVAELDAGKGGELMLDLKPGEYLLFCNIPGHFTSGMWTTITVK